MTPPPRPAQNTDQLLELLHDAGAEFVIIAGVAAIIHGAMTMNRDLDFAAYLRRALRVAIEKPGEVYLPQTMAAESRSG